MEEFRIVLADACKIVKESSRKRVISGADEDGRVMVEFSEPVGGRRVKMLTPDEINGMLYKEETSESPANAEEAMAEETEPPTAGQEESGESALERIPKDAQTGEPQYTQTDADTAWDAIVEQTEGDEDMARSVVDSTVRDKEAALKKLESSNPKPGATVAEKIAAAKEHKAAIEAARQELEQWKAIAEVENSRKAEAEAKAKAEEEEAKARAKAEEERTALKGVNLSEEKDENGNSFVVSSDGTTTFGEVRDKSGLPAAPIKLSVGYQDKNGSGYGLTHIEANHGAQIKKEGFASVEDFVSYVAKNYDENNIKVGKRRTGGSITYLLQVTGKHDNTLFIELSRDGSYWNVNSAGVFRKGYSDKKETVAKTEPQQPSNAISERALQSADQSNGILPASPNGKPTVSTSKVSESSETKQEKAENSISAKVKEAKSKSAPDVKRQQTRQSQNEPQNIEVQIKHLEEIKDYPGADKKIVQSEIDRLKAKEEAKAKSKSKEENGVDDAKIDTVLEALSKGDEKAEQLVRGLTSRELSKLRSKVKASPVLENEWLHRVRTRDYVSLHDRLLENQYVEPVKRVSGTFKMTDYIAPKNVCEGRLSGVYHDDKGYAVASDGIILVADKGSYDPKLKGKVIGKDGVAMENKFPDWQKVIPVAEKTKSSGIDAEDLHRFVAGVLKANKHAYISVRFPDGTTVSFNADRLNLMLRAMKRLGADKLLYTKPGMQLVAKSYKGVALLMWRVSAEDDSMEEYGYAYPGNTVLYHRGEVVSEMSQEERVLRDAVIDRLRESGMEVITDEEAGQRVLDEANGKAKLSAKKRRALETVSASHDEKHQPTVVSSADGAKILKELDDTKEKYENLSNRINTFIGDVAKALGAKRGGSASEYASFETKNGKIITIRLSNHNAKVSNFDANGETDGISIVVSPKKSGGMTNDGKAHVVEYYYDAIKLRRAEGKPLADIVRSIKQALYSGEFEDTTGLAERQEVNAEITDRVRFFRTAKGEAYGFTVGGKIYIDPKIANTETPIHEYAHLWAAALRGQNPKEWRNIVELMKGTSVWDEVKKRYPELNTDDDIADEVLATYSGRRGAERLREEQRKIAGDKGGVFEKAEAISALERVKQALRKFWKSVADFLHIHYTSAEEVADRVMKDLLDGVDPGKFGKGGVAGELRFNARQKRALETATWQQRDVEANQATVVSSADGAKIIKELDSLANSLDEKDSNRSKTFIGDVARAIGAKEKGSSSQYATFETKNGRIVTIRLANHNASSSKFDNAGRDNAISIVITNRNNEGIRNDGNAHIVEFYYNKGKLIKAEGKPLAEIVRSIRQALYSGEFKDTTGLAEVQEVNAGDAIRFQFTGERGAEAADRAEEVTVRLDNLSVAREMEKAGKDAKVIKMATGWERGADGKWRYETGDASLWDGLRLTKRGTEERTTLGEMLEDSREKEELLAAYPQLKAMPLVFKDMGYGEVGHYDGKEIVLNSYLLTDDSGRFTENASSVLAHEIQHAIQHIEGFATGGNLKAAMEYLSGNKRADVKIKQQLAYKLSQEKGLGLSEEEVNSLIGHLEYEDISDDELQKQIDALCQKHNITEDQLEDIYPMDSVWHEAYNRISGETEARNVQKRMSMTAEERRASLAADTEDVARDSQILLFDDTGKNMSLESPKEERIEKLRESKPVEITGNEYKGKYELNRESAKEWLKNNLRGEYRIKDTGETVELRKDGIQKVTSHSMGNEAHLKSLAAIPQMIENSIFIDEVPNEKNNGKYDRYRYYVCGLKIGGEDYTAKITIGVKGGYKYYDHSLTQIEKGSLLDNIDALSTTYDDKGTTLSSVGKDSRLLSILQVKDEKKPNDGLYRVGGGKELRDGRKIEFVRKPTATYNALARHLQAEGIKPDMHEARTGSRYMSFEKDGVQWEVRSSDHTKPEYYGEAQKPVELTYYKDKQGEENLSVSVDLGTSGYNIEDMKALMAEIDRLKNDAGEVKESFDRGVASDEVVERYPLLSQALGVKSENEVRAKEEAREHAEEARKQEMRSAVEDMAGKLHLNNVDIVDKPAGRGAGRRERAKGMFERSTGRITINTGNCADKRDAVVTLLHEAVAHHGLRKLFGENFETFLDNVYNSANAEIRRIIDKHSSRYGGDKRTATEEYMASLAERTDFENAKKSGWWQRIKDFFLKMLEKIGLKGFKGEDLSDNELRYVLWRSYENLKSGGKDTVISAADDLAKQSELKVGEFAPDAKKTAHDAKKTAHEENAEEVNERFNNELTRYQNGEMDKNEMLHLGRPQGVMRTFLPNLPIVMHQRVIKKGSEKKHEVEVSAIMNMPQHLSSPIFVFQRSEDTIGVLTDMRDRNGKNVCVAIELKRQIQQGAEYLEVNDVRSFHGREFKNIVEPIANNKTLKWVDKEKGLAYLSSASQPVQQEIDKQVLDTAAKVVENFENPKSESENDALFRDGDAKDYEKAQARETYERRVSTGMFQSREAIQDSMLSLKVAMDAIEEATAGKAKRIEDYDGFENAYLGENRLSSVNPREVAAFTQLHIVPMLKEVNHLAPTAKERAELVDYMFAKHGLERNEYMRQREAEKKYDTHKKKHPDSSKTVADFTDESYDYAGLTALTGKDDVLAAETDAQRMVAEYEKDYTFHGTWNEIYVCRKKIC